MARTATQADPFVLLSVPYTATPDEVAAAFRKAALDTHPDTNPDSDGAAFRAAKEAYDALRTAGQIDAERRRWQPRERNHARTADPLAGKAWNGHAWVPYRHEPLDPAEFPECKATWTKRKPGDSGPDFHVSIDIHNPPPGWTPGKRRPPNAACTVVVEGGADGKPDYGVWSTDPLTYVFGLATGWTVYGT